MDNVEIFRAPDDYPITEDDGSPVEPGWYYWYCQPGCLPDSEAFGPFPTAREARESARDDAEELDAQTSDTEGSHVG